MNFTGMRNARRAAGVTQDALAETLGINRATISKYESGQITPSLDQLGKIAKALNTTVYEMVGPDWDGWSKLDTSDAFSIKKASPYSSEAMRLAEVYDSLDSHGQKAVRAVADVEKERCSSMIQMEQPEPDNVIYITNWFQMPMSAGTGQEAGQDDPDELELTKRPPRGTSYVAPVSGVSMEPTYYDGDKLFIRAQEEIEPGQIGVFFMDGKQWVKELGDGVLISHNPEYPPIPMRADIRCQGLVLGVCDDSYFE